MVNGDYILSAKHTDAVYRVSHDDGHIIWRLNGTKLDFQMLGTSRSSLQHDAQVLSTNNTHTVLTLFDNAIGDGPFERLRVFERTCPAA